MVRLIALLIVMVGLGVVYEDVTGNSVGVKHTINKVAGFSGFSFGTTSRGTSTAFGGFGTLSDRAAGN